MNDAICKSHYKTLVLLIKEIMHSIVYGGCVDVHYHTRANTCIAELWFLIQKMGLPSDIGSHMTLQTI